MRSKVCLARSRICSNCHWHKSRVLVEVDQATGSTYSLEADQATGSTYLWAFTYKMYICMSVSPCHPKTNELLDTSCCLLLYLTTGTGANQRRIWFAQFARISTARVRILPSRRLITVGTVCILSSKYLILPLEQPTLPITKSFQPKKTVVKFLNKNFNKILEKP